MPYTVPNQRVVTIYREPVKSDFLGIKNENWQYAARDLGAHSLMLYLYFASNANGYALALSPAAIRQAIGMARSTYQDQLLKLIDKGYLIPTGANSFDFYEVPKPHHAVLQNSNTVDGLDSENGTDADKANDLPAQAITGENIEIYNTNIPPNSVTNIKSLSEAGGDKKARNERSKNSHTKVRAEKAANTKTGENGV